MKKAIGFALGLVMASVGFASAQEEHAVKETHGAWNIKCGDSCYMEQIKQDNAGRPLMLVRLSKLPAAEEIDGKTYTVRAELFTRLDFYLPAGMQLQVDAGETRRIPFERCQPNGCGSLPLLTKEMVDELSAGGSLKATMLLTPNKAMEANLSLDGFSAALGAL